MRELLVSLEVAGGVALLLLLSLVVVVLRRRRLTDRYGTFDCSLRRPGQARRWALGVARYESDRLDWYRVFSFSPRPSQTLSRGAILVLDRRVPDATEAMAVQPGALVVECAYEGQILALGMTQDEYTGFASWLESSPPGQGPGLS
ncbi:DUF2550 domain-containing protein [Kineococcus gynurae]|uniref:DUF2550 domain-containing protein n=1 Tax=Kineococcus gynurae TaxID=452979 RepID=A0ABV5LMZ8_9ACTN